MRSLVPHTAHGGEAHGTLLLFQGLAMAVACLVVLGMAYAGYQRVLSGAARRHKGSKAGTNPKVVQHVRTRVLVLLLSEGRGCCTIACSNDARACSS